MSSFLPLKIRRAHPIFPANISYDVFILGQLFRVEWGRYCGKPFVLRICGRLMRTGALSGVDVIT
jgi:hypothetical protein